MTPTRGYTSVYVRRLIQIDILTKTNDISNTDTLISAVTKNHHLLA